MPSGRAEGAQEPRSRDGGGGDGDGDGSSDDGRRRGCGSAPSRDSHFTSTSSNPTLATVPGKASAKEDEKNGKANTYYSYYLSRPGWDRANLKRTLKHPLGSQLWRAKERSLLSCCRPSRFVLFCCDSPVDWLSTDSLPLSALPVILLLGNCASQHTHYWHTQLRFCAASPLNKTETHDSAMLPDSTSSSSVMLVDY